jgi:hypothetical protein
MRESGTYCYWNFGGQKSHFLHRKAVSGTPYWFLVWIVGTIIPQWGKSYFKAAGYMCFVDRG